MPSDTPIDAAEDNVPLKTKRLPRRTLVLVALLVCVCAAWAIRAVDDHQLRSSLADSAQDEIAHYSQPYVGQPKTATTTVVTTAREYVLFGEAFGKVALFVKAQRSEGAPQYGGVEMGFKQDGADWIMTDSGGCTGEDCVVKAKRAFGDS